MVWEDHTAGVPMAIPKITSSNAARPQTAVNAENTQTIFVSDQPHISK